MEYILTVIKRDEVGQAQEIERPTDGTIGRLESVSLKLTGLLYKRPGGCEQPPRCAQPKFHCQKQGVCGPNLPPAWRATPKCKDGIYLDGDQVRGSWTGSTSQTTGRRDHWPLGEQSSSSKGAIAAWLSLLVMCRPADGASKGHLLIVSHT